MSSSDPSSLMAAAEQTELGPAPPPPTFPLPLHPRRHMCMALRGVAKSGASTVTTCYLGAFRDSAELRAEFLSRTK